jgi:hypothetical protein
MFQSLNQFIVLASLLSAGIGGLAAPTRRQEGPVTIFSQGTKLCLDAGQGIFATRLVLYVWDFFNTFLALTFLFPLLSDGCTGNVNQEWNLRQTSTGLSTIESVSSTLCAGIAGKFTCFDSLSYCGS